MLAVCVKLLLVAVRQLFRHTRAIESSGSLYIVISNGLIFSLEVFPFVLILHDYNENILHNHFFSRYKF